MEDSPKRPRCLLSEYRLRIACAAVIVIAGIWILTATRGIADIIESGYRDSESIIALYDVGPVNRIDFDPDARPALGELRIPWYFQGNVSSPFPLIIAKDVAFQFAPDDSGRSRTFIFWCFGYKTQLYTHIWRRSHPTDSLTETNLPVPDDAATSEIPIYVTPYYNSQGPEVSVGAYSGELTTATAASIAELAKKMKAEWATLPVETMYVMSIRLYDLGLKKESVYWFYSAQVRALLFKSLLSEESIGGIGNEGFERIQAYSAFHRLAGEYINGYAFGELQSLQESIRLVKAENETPPDLAIIYPDLDFIDRGSWPDKTREVAADLDKLLDYIANNAEEIQETRKKNGIEGKY